VFSTVEPVSFLTLAEESCRLLLEPPASLGSLRSLLLGFEEEAYSGSPAIISLGFPLAGVFLSLAISEATSSASGGLCMSMVLVRARAWGGAGRATGSAGGGGGAEAGSGSLYSMSSSKNEEF
jgi:hypothetical protein